MQVVQGRHYRRCVSLEGKQMISPGVKRSQSKPWFASRSRFSEKPCAWEMSQHVSPTLTRYAVVTPVQKDTSGLRSCVCGPTRRQTSSRATMIIMKKGKSVRYAWEFTPRA